VTTQEIVSQAHAWLAAALGSPTEIGALLAAGCAAGLTISSSFVKTMVPLRWLAVCSNVGFLAYGVLHPSYVMALMHGVLLPINCIRLAEMKRLTARVHAATSSKDLSVVWLKPYMKSTRHKAGTVLFSKGDAAEHLYILAEGHVEFIEIGVTIGPGQMFGEIAFFAPDNRRTLSARCSEDCLVLSINQSTVRQLYFQNPAFGFQIVGLIANRLSADVARLQDQLTDRAALA
jgi:CRP/FNR family cyclic AMP-dependent transcriptional regulator